jgi:uncharacterized protein (TIGR02217 family)
MSFHESPRFPDKLAYGLQAGPTDSRTRLRTESGRVTTNVNWAHFLTRFNGTTTHRSQADRDEIDAFFRAVRANGFRIKDWSDYKSDGRGVLTQLSPTTWQLGKTYTSGSATYTRTISKPVSAITVAGGGVYSVDYTTGIVTKTSGADPTSWSGEFDVPVQFDADELMWDIAARSGDALMYVCDSLTMTELRL